MSLSTQGDLAGPTPSATTELVSARAILLLLSLLVIVLLLSHVLRRRRVRIIHETVLAILLGIAFGLFVRFSRFEPTLSPLLAFNHTYFFNLLLPPIILDSAYRLRKTAFLRHLVPVIAFAFVGTTISIFVTAGIVYLVSLTHAIPAFSFFECLIYGCALASTDPVAVLSIFAQLHVDPRLYYVLFGESLLNDSVSIVFFNSLLRTITRASLNQDTKPQISTRQVFFDFSIGLGGSLLVGLVSGLAVALVLRVARLSTRLQMCLALMFPYLAFFVAQSVEPLSGVVSLLFSGMTLKHYANLSPTAEKGASAIFGVLAKLSELFVFAYLGIAMTCESKAPAAPAFLLISLFALILGRMSAVFPISAILNLGEKYYHAGARQINTPWTNSRNRQQSNNPPLDFAESGDVLYSATSANNVPTTNEGNRELVRSPSTPLSLDQSAESSLQQQGSCNNHGSAVRNEPLIPFNHQVLLCWAGLRGAVTCALASQVDTSEGNVLRATTLRVVVLTIVFFGGTMPFAIKYFRIKTNCDTVSQQAGGAQSENSDDDDASSMEEEENNQDKNEFNDHNDEQTWRHRRPPYEKSTSRDPSFENFNIGSSSSTSRLTQQPEIPFTRSRPTSVSSSRHTSSENHKTERTEGFTKLAPPPSSSSFGAPLQQAPLGPGSFAVPSFGNPEIASPSNVWAREITSSDTIALGSAPVVIPPFSPPPGVGAPATLRFDGDLKANLNTKSEAPRTMQPLTPPDWDRISGAETAEWAAAAATASQPPAVGKLVVPQSSEALATTSPAKNAEPSRSSDDKATSSPSSSPHNLVSHL